MKSGFFILLLSVNLTAYAGLSFELPPNAKYTASEQSITKAKDDLRRHLVGEAESLTNLFSTPTICGPGMWNILKDSPHFSKPPLAKSTAKIPLPDGNFQELPFALLQSDDEVASFRKAFAELLTTQGKLTIREPDKEEFMVFWAVIPFDKFDGPLLVASGKDCTFFFMFGKKGDLFWADEVKKMRFKK